MAQPVNIADPIPEIDEKIEEKVEITCQHHWVIQPATGPISPGVCQNCGETREFKNYVEASTWGDDKSAHRGASADVSRAVSGHLEEDEEE